MIKKFESYFRSLCSCNQGEQLRDKFLCFLLIVYTRSWHRKIVGWFSARMIAIFSCHGQVYISIRVNGEIAILSLRKNNGADYRMAMSVLLLGEYKLPVQLEVGHIIDAGANIGSFSILAHRYFPDAKLVCFEPEPDNFNQLELNMLNNKIPALLKNEAVWFEDCHLAFESDESHKGFVSQSASENLVKCTKPEIPENTLLKMDIEGGEFVVLLPLLERATFLPRTILLEVHWGKDWDKNRNLSFINCLNDLGYVFSPEPDCSIFSQSFSLTLD